jgi:hypothetical protein
LQGPAISIFTQLSDFLQAHPLQETQLVVNLPDPHQPLPENISSQELLRLAQQHIRMAQLSIVVAAHPFWGKSKLFSRHFQDANTFLNATIARMCYLLVLIPMIIACPLELESTTLFKKHEEIKVEVYRYINEAEKLIALLQKENGSDRWNVTQKAVKFVDLLQELFLSFGGDKMV